jgi:hypothetical protein
MTGNRKARRAVKAQANGWRDATRDPRFTSLLSAMKDRGWEPQQHEGAALCHVKGQWLKMLLPDGERVIGTLGLVLGAPQALGEWQQSESGWCGAMFRVATPPRLDACVIVPVDRVAEIEETIRSNVAPRPVQSVGIH